MIALVHFLIANPEMGTDKESIGGEHFFTRFYLFDPLRLNDHFHCIYSETKEG